MARDPFVDEVRHVREQYTARFSFDLAIYRDLRSASAAAFRKSELALAFTDGILDPQVEHDRGEAYIPDPQIDRRDSEMVLRHLREKYS